MTIIPQTKTPGPKPCDLHGEREALRLMGGVTKEEFAANMGCSLQMAHHRLHKLKAAGMAESYRTRKDSMTLTWVVTAPGATAAA
jgi:hypothetical protein